MKRFSPKQTLSNIATGVRETVEFMNGKMIAAIILFAATVTMMSLSDSNFAFAQAVSLSSSGSLSGGYVAESTQSQISALATAISTYCTKTSKDYNETICEITKAKAGISGDKNTSRCLAIDDRIADTVKDALKACGDGGLGRNLTTCMKKISTCTAADQEMNPDDEDEDEGSSTSSGEFCNRALADKCPGLSAFNQGRDYRQEKKDAETERKDKKKELDGLLDDQKDIQKSLAKKQREITESQENDALKARKQEKALNDQLEEGLKSIGTQQKAAYEKAKSEYEALDIQVISMQKQARDAADAVTDAQEDLQTMCRASAEKKYQEAEKTRLAVLAAKKKNAGASTAVSGSSSRIKAQTARARAIDYAQYLNECLTGVSAEGAGGQSNVARKKRAQDSANKTLEAQAALLDKRRAAIADSLKQMETDGNTQQTELVKKANEQLQSMNEERTLVATQNARRIQEFQQEQSSAVSTIQQKISTANTELMETQKEASLAASRINCAGKVAQKSESQRDKVVTGFNDSDGNIATLRSMCTNRKTLECSNAAPGCTDLLSADTANAPKKTGGGGIKK